MVAARSYSAYDIKDLHSPAYCVVESVDPEYPALKTLKISGSGILAPFLFPGVIGNSPEISIQTLYDTYIGIELFLQGGAPNADHEHQVHTAYRKTGKELLRVTPEQIDVLVEFAYSRLPPINWEREVETLARFDLCTTFAQAVSEVTQA